MTARRAILIILDACGVGALPDAAAYGDEGAATLPHVAEAVGGLTMPNSERLGLGHIARIDGLAANNPPAGAFGRMAERSPGKDSTTGHWELAGVALDQPFPLFPGGFPTELVAEFERRAHVRTIGNCAASGTEIIERLGEEHLRTGALILYTSADSVFQLAAHEDLYPVPRLHEVCRIARDLLVGPYEVGRVIARPFVGTPGSFQRTAGRKDFSRTPPSETLLDRLAAAGYGVLAIGKIYDLFAGRGISTATKTATNDEVMQAILSTVESDSEHRLIFANLVDFDQLWGHRNDERNFASALEQFDRQLGRLLPLLHRDDLLILTADHGCDPTQKHSTDHSREYVPLMLYGSSIRPGVNLGTRASFADLGATLAQFFELPPLAAGKSFLDQVLI